MKKLLYITLLTSMCMLTACGSKKSQTISDNLANMSTEIQGMDEINAQIQQTQAEFLTENNGNTALDLENAMSGETDLETGIVNDAVNDDSISYDSVSSDMSVSADGASEFAGDMNGEISEISEMAAASGISMDDYFATVVMNNTLSVSNMSGKDLKEVYASFNTGTINNVEITSGKKLKDGNKVNYVIADIESLRSASNVVLTINAINKRGESISFGDVRIVDPTNMNIVLINTDDGYSMYVR